MKFDTVQSIITLCLESIGMYLVISELCHKGTIFQRIHGHFVKYHDKKNGSHVTEFML